jgi:hypothetical protein
MRRNEKALSFLLVFTMLFTTLTLTVIPGAQQSSIAHAEMSTPEVTLGDFESTDETWDFLIGSSGQLGNGEFTLDSTTHQSGHSAGKLQLDFSKYYVVSLEKYLFKRILPSDALELSFWVKTSDIAKFDLILLDNSNQNHQQTIVLQPTTDWQKVTVSSFTSGTAYTKWGGKNDGIWYGPLKKMNFRVSKPQMKSGKTAGAIWFDNVQAKVNAPELTFSQGQVGNVFTGTHTGTFNILTTGDAIDWAVSNAWGEPVVSGSEAVSGSKLPLNVTVPEDGYYRLKVSSYRQGTLVKTLENTFAMLPDLDMSTVSNDSPFGIQTHYGINWNWEMSPLVKYAGTKSVRDSFYWSEVEVNKGQYSYNPKVTLPMQGMKQDHIDPFLTFAFSNKYYDGGQTPYTDEAHIAYGNYVKEMLGKFGSQIQAGEIWNEFNLPYFGGNGPAASRADVYFNMLKRGYEAAKQVRPDLNVVGAATAGTPLEWLADLFELGGLDYMDTLSVHPYRYPKTPEGLLEEIEKLNQLVRSHNNGETIPIWFTEIGWPTHLNPQGVDENTQAAYLIRTYALSIAAGIEKIYWYDLMDDGIDKLYNEHNFGIIHNSSDALGAYTPKPAYVALATMTRQLTGANPTAQNVIGDIYQYTFDKNNEDIHVLWSLSKKEVTLNTQSPLVVTDMMGRKVTYTPSQGKVYLTLTGEPLFVQGNMDSLAQGSQFTLQSAPAYTGDPVTLTLHVNDLGQQDEMTAEVSFMGVSQQVTVNAPGDYSLVFPGVDQIGKKTAAAKIHAAGISFASLSATVDVLQAEQVTAKHIIKNGSDVLEVRLENSRPSERRLTRIDWSIGASSGSEHYNEVIPGNSMKTIDFPLVNLPERTLLSFQLKLYMEDGAKLQSEGSLKIVPSGEMVLMTFRTPSGLNDVQDLTGIDLKQDVNSRIATYAGPEDFGGKLWTTYDNNQLYLYASVHDDVFSQTKRGESIWEGDSIQFAISAGTPGEKLQWYEYGMALTSQGPELYRWMAPQGVVTGTITNPNLQVNRDEAGKNTIYQLALPWSELAPVVPSDGLLSMSIVVNENDGNGRKGYVEWGGGIGSSKQSSLFKPILLLQQKVFDQVNMSAPITQIIKGAHEEVSLSGLLKGVPADLSGAVVSFISSDPEVLDATVMKVENGVVYGSVVGKKAGSAALKAVVSQNGITVESNGLEFQVENTPVITASTTEWTREDVTVTVLSSAGSGKYEYSVGDNATWMDYKAPIVITENGASNVRVRYQDESGYVSESASLEVHVDKQSPVVTLTGTRSYSVTENVYVSCTAADTLSGLAANPCNTPIVNGVPAYTFGIGSHSVSVSATDLAGNLNTVEGSYFITLTYEGLAQLTEKFLLETNEPGDHGILNSLLKKLEQADKDSYIHELSAQSGKDIMADRAAILIQLAQLL